MFSWDETPTCVEPAMRTSELVELKVKAPPDVRLTSPVVDSTDTDAPVIDVLVAAVREMSPDVDCSVTPESPLIVATLDADMVSD
jgi:hypothetical protein